MLAVMMDALVNYLADADEGRGHIKEAKEGSVGEGNRLPICK